MQKQTIRDFYEKNMYGIWRDGETVSYELLGKDEQKPEEDGPVYPFKATGGDLVKIRVRKEDRETEFVIHAYLPEAKDAERFPKGSPFVVCMHPIKPADYIMAKGYALFVMDAHDIASDDTRHQGAFYELYPYTAESESQTGVLMAWAWGASKVLDAVIAGLDKEYLLDAEASMVTGVSRYGKATAVCGAFDERFRMVIPACSGAGGLALFCHISEGKTYDFSQIGGPSDYTYGKNEPLDCLQSEEERGWFNDRFLGYKTPSEIPMDQENLPVLAMSRERYYFIIAACIGEDWVNAPAMWECYKRANEVYKQEGLEDHLAVHFHKEGHAVLQEDAEIFIRYFDRMYFGMDTGIEPEEYKVTVFDRMC